MDTARSDKVVTFEVEEMRGNAVKRIDEILVISDSTSTLKYFDLQCKEPCHIFWFANGSMVAVAPPCVAGSTSEVATILSSLRSIDKHSGRSRHQLHTYVH